jgi:hypothetical protein
MQRFSVSCLLLTLAALLSGCGGEESGTRDQVNRVYERAMRAVHAADWSALEAELTKEARFTLQRDLTRLSSRLAHPDDGTREREIARARLGAEAEAAIAEASSGSLPAALAFFVRISPRDEVPARKAFKQDKFQAEILYALGDGTLRPIRFVRKPDGWYVSELQL